MILLEYEAKNILKDAGIPVPKGVVVTNSTPLRLPVVLKSQVPTGGRGKLGGIKVIEKDEQIQSVVDDLLTLPIKDFIPSVIYAEEKLAINKELYLSITIDRTKDTIQIMAHKSGGIEVEANNPDGFLKIDLSATNPIVAGEKLAELYDIPSQVFILQDLVEKLQDCFVKNDATLIEINPLVLTADNKLVAGDCKMELDNAAAFRHPEWDFEDKPTSANFVTLDPRGTVATIANGAGLAMATVDAVTAAGLSPANFLDIGGGATTARVVECFQQITEFPRVNAIVINIFGGIVQCDTVAQAIIEARGTFPALPTLYIRLSGNRSAEAAGLLQHEQLPLYSSLEECIQELTR